MGEPGSGRLDSIQIMRGAAALLVVLAHSFDAVEANPTRYSPSYLAGVGHVENFGAIGVDLFFVISGFVMAVSVRRLLGCKQALDFLALRWIRIAPPFLIACSLFALRDYAQGGSELTWRSVWNSVGFVPLFDGDGYSRPALLIAWTLSFEFTFYLAVAAMVAIGCSKKLLWLAGAMVIAGLVGAGVDPSPFILDWLLNPIVIEFSLGIVAYELWQRGFAERLRGLWLALGIAAGVALIVQLAVGYRNVSEDPLIVDSSLSLERAVLWGLPMFAIFMAMLLAARPGSHPQGGRLARTLGDASYSIYLIHLLVLLVMNQVLGVLPGRVPGDVVIVLGLAAGAVGGWLYWRAVERPLTERLRLAYARRAHTRPHLIPEAPTGFGALGAPAEWPERRSVGESG